MPRIVRPEDIPICLWDPKHPPTIECAAGCLLLPGRFADAYRDTLLECGLHELAADESAYSKGATGDLDDGGASKHFAQRYVGSSARVQLYTLDPSDTFSTTSDALFTLLSGASVRLLDIPIGAGAGSFALLSILAELRTEKILPQNPIKVTIIGGDFDNEALAIAEKVFRKLQPSWLSNAIDATLTLKSWNVKSDELTADLLEAWSENASHADEFAILIANFSGFLWKKIGLTDKPEIEDASAVLRQVFVRAAKLNAPIFWLEPQQKQSAKMFKWLEDHVLPRFARLSPAFTGPRTSKASARSVVRPSEVFTARLQGIHLRRTNVP